MNHIAEQAPALANAIRASMRGAPSESVIRWARNKAPSRHTTSKQKAISSDAVNKALNAPTPHKPSDYV